MTSRIDLNADVGEGAAHDEEILRHVTSANIACGGHAGNEATMRASIALALLHNVAIGAHPGYADRKNFGRVETGATAAGIHALARDQILALQELASSLGTRVNHVKPHGALYNRAAGDAAAATAVVEAIASCGRDLTVFALAGSELERIARAAGLHVCAEAFADRRYAASGRLTPRSDPRAVIDDVGLAAAQAVAITTRTPVLTPDGVSLLISADTLCVHGDNPHAAQVTRAIRAALQSANIEVIRYDR